MLPTMAFKRADKGTMGHWVWRVYVRLSRMGWDVIASLVLIHFAITYGLLSAIEGGPFAELPTFLYIYATTASTVGYGDFSPGTTAGRLVAVFWLFPGGIAIFTTVLAKIGGGFADSWRRRMTGLGNFADLRGHIVILGWRGGFTEDMVSEIEGDSTDSREVLVVAGAASNPLPGDIKYVRAQTLTDREALERAGIANASAIILAGKDDNETLTAGLVVGKMAPACHIVAYFNQPEPAAIVAEHVPQIECVTSVSIANTVRAMQDPGSSHVITELLMSLDGSTNWRLDVPDDAPALSYDRLGDYLRRTHRITLIGYCRPGERPVINPQGDDNITPDTDLFVVAASRPDPKSINWAAIAATSKD